MSDEQIQSTPEQPAIPAEARERFEAHLPLLERVVSQVLASSAASVRDMIYLGACVLLRVAIEWNESAQLPFKEYAEVTITSELLHQAHYPTPLLHLPAELGPYQPRLNAMAQALATMLPAAPTALATYAAISGRHPMLLPAYPHGEFLGAAPAHAKPGPSVGAFIGQLFKKRLALILALALLTEGGITLYTIKSPKTYLAASVINSGIGEKDPINGGGDWFSQGTILANITELIKSRTVLENTIASLGLHTTPDDLAKQLTVTRTGATGLLRVEAESSNANGASELANTVVREFLKFYAGAQSHEARSNKSFFESQVDVAASKLHQAENRLKAFKATNIPEMQATVPSRVAELIAQRDEAARSLAASQAGLAAVEHELARIKSDPLLRERVVDNAAVMTADDKLRELEMNMLDAKQIYGADSPVVQQLKNQIARAKGQLHVSAVEATEQNPALADANAKLVQYKADIAQNGARLSMLNSELAQLQPQAREASTNQVTYEQLMRDVHIAETQYMDLTTKYSQSALSANGAANLNITVVDAALPPEAPESSKLALKLAIGLILSLGLGLFISYLMSLREREETDEDSETTPEPKLLTPGLST